MMHVVLFEVQHQRFPIQKLPELTSFNWRTEWKMLKVKGHGVVSAMAFIASLCQKLKDNRPMEQVSAKWKTEPQVRFVPSDT